MVHRKRSERIRAFWNSRADHGVRAGTRDTIAKQLEIQAIEKYVVDGMSVLDAGCGNGITAVELARRHEVDIVGVDFAPALIAAAKSFAEGEALKGKVSFLVADTRDLPLRSEQFDLVYTERTLINLSDWPTQKSTIDGLGNVIAPGGRYLMCENSQDGLDNLNVLRQQLGLPVIKRPWHNRYLRDVEVNSTLFETLHLEQVECFSSTYYFLSRVVNAWLAAQKGEEPDYEAPINTLALKLPPIGDLAQVRLWVWRKRSPA
jgi:ubiquinone/menaquinone biosynthesis C-methylase UbiE